MAQSNIRFLAPLAVAIFALMPAYIFSQTRGTPKNTVGCTSLRLSASLSIDSAKYKAPPYVMGA
jgi:hypothetical protein